MSASDNRLSVLFVCRDPGRIRNFEGVLRVLAERGHNVHVAVEKPRERIVGQLHFIEGLAAEFPAVTIGRAPARERDRWLALARAVRFGHDHLHYLQPRFDGSAHFRERSGEDAPAVIRRVAALTGTKGRIGRRLTRRALREIEAAIPTSPSIDAFLEEQRPDVVLITPYVWFGGHQTDWVRSARRLGIRSVACLFSWDNLTSKGSICEWPDALTVWNDAQRREATELHGLPKDRVVVTGAQNWDHWFDWSPSRDRETFCADAGLRADQPYVVYVESSPYTEGEAAFAQAWISAMRERESLRDVGVLIRPHPQSDAAQWAASGVMGLDGVCIFPREGQIPLIRAHHDDLFDSIHFSHAVVGINTTAFIDAAIIGRPCLSPMLPEWQRSQQATVHFHHLLGENGGHLEVAGTMDGHLDQLEAVIRNAGQPDPRRAEFVRRFVRPHGLDTPAVPRFADAVERLCETPASRGRPTVLGARSRGYAARAAGTFVGPVAKQPAQPAKPGKPGKTPATPKAAKVPKQPKPPKPPKPPKAPKVDASRETPRPPAAKKVS